MGEWGFIGQRQERNPPGRGRGRYGGPEAGMTVALKEIAEGQ